jgi:thiol-disulfide isomerase/thioredoxin
MPEPIEPTTPTATTAAATASTLAPAPAQTPGPAPAPLPAPAVAAAASHPLPAPPAETSAPAGTPPGRPESGRRRPTWGEVTAVGAELPPLEGSETKTVARESEPAAAQQGAPVDDPTKPFCEYDDRRRRIVDFRLPDLEGKPVRFRDLDADLVLLDFWGTWCPPCVQSIPHLVELQAGQAGKRLKVVGIACEKDAPSQAARRVAEAAESLKINYPVLLSRNDGSCPLQGALHIQAYPTLVLVDREGRVLWWDQGATPATLARLDRMIASPPREGETRRY